MSRSWITSRSMRGRPRRCRLSSNERIHAVIAVVEPHLERQPAGPYAAIIGLGVMHRVHSAADLGGQHEVAARLAIKRAAEAVLALRQTVPGCGVVVADAGIPGGFQCGGGL